MDDNKKYYLTINSLINNFLKDDPHDISTLSNLFKKHDKDYDTIKTYDKNFSYKNLFLNLYYDIVRTITVMENANKEGKADKFYERLMCEFEAKLFEMGMYDEYGVGMYLDEKEYQEKIDKYELR